MAVAAAVNTERVKGGFIISALHLIPTSLPGFAERYRCMVSSPYSRLAQRKHLFFCPERCSFA